MIIIVILFNFNVGFTVNIPWNQISGDAEYLAAFLRIVMPIAYEVKFSSYKFEK